MGIPADEEGGLAHGVSMRRHLSSIGNESNENVLEGQYTKNQKKMDDAILGDDIFEGEGKQTKGKGMPSEIEMRQAKGREKRA